MAVCIGCGLEVNNGILEVNVCGTPTSPNTTTGGLQCDTTTEDGCLKVVLNDTHTGCGLNAVGGALEVDACLNGGILCGATDDDAEDNCVYVNVHGQGSGACVAFDGTQTKFPGVCVITPGYFGADGAGVETGGPFTSAGNPGFFGACESPNCNGLIRTCDGLWAPPSLPSINFSCGQIAEFARVPMTNLLFPLTDQAGLLAGSSDGFPPYGNDMAVGLSTSQIIIVNAFKYDPCAPINAMSWTAFSINFELPGGELWRFGLHERICSDSGSNGGTDSFNNHCTNGWSLQSVQYIDTRGTATNVTNIGSVQINDNSTWGFPKFTTAGDNGARMEAFISAQRLVGTTALSSHFSIAYDFQYRNMGSGYHHGVSQMCAKTGTTLTPGT